MKAFVIGTIILVILGVIIITKPSDEDCYKQIDDKLTEQVNMSNQNEVFKLTEEIAIQKLSKYTQDILRIEDNILYKNIYIEGTDIKIAIGLFGTVIFQGDDAIQQIQEKLKQKTEIEPRTNNSLIKDIKNLFKKKSQQESSNNQNQSSIARNGETMLAFWQTQLQSANENLNADKNRLTKTQRFHLGRLPNTKKREINDAQMQIEQDQIRVQQYNDSVRKYQE